MGLLNKCDNCNKPPKSGMHKIQSLLGKGVYIFCSEKCKQEYIHKFELELKYGINKS